MIDNSSPELTLVLYIAIFVGVLLVYEGIRQLLFGGETDSQVRNRRMRMVNAGASPEDVISVLASDAEGQRGGSLLVRLRRKLRQAGVLTNPILVILGCALLAGFAFVVLDSRTSRLIAVPGSLLAGCGIPYLFLEAAVRERMKKLNTQLPEALDLMARGLKVGHPLPVTVQSVAKDMPDPIGTEFGIIADQISYGDDIVSAFRQFADRVNVDDARFLAVSVGIQHGTGGNLGRILSVLSDVIRDRQMMRKKIKALSSEGRLSSSILTVLPIALIAMTHLSYPPFYMEISDEPLFLPMAIATVVLIVGQAIILNRLVNFKF